MRKLLICAVLMGILASCAQYTCPTYSTARGPRTLSASVKKSPPSRPKSAGYKKATKALAESE